MRLALLVVVALASSAHADSTKLGDARRALDELRYDDAQRLLVAALAEGNNSAAAMRELYQLAAEVEAVLGHADLAEQYDRRWLAIDPNAQLSAARSPKVRDPFVAAQAYTTAHGALAVHAVRNGANVDVAVTNDPLAMVRSACELTGTPVALGEGRASLATAATHVAVCDEHANRLAELDVATTVTSVVTRVGESPPAPIVETPSPPVEIPVSHRWTTWGIPTLITGVAGLICLGYALRAQTDLDEHVTTDKGERNGLIIGASVSGALMIGFGIPTAILYLDQRPKVVPTPVRGGAGVSLILPF